MTCYYLPRNIPTLLKGKIFEKSGGGEGKNRQRTKRKKGRREGSECLAVCRIWVSDLGPWRLVARSAGNLFSRPFPLSPSRSSSPPLFPARQTIFFVHRSPRPLAKAHRKRLKTVQAGQAAELFAALSAGSRIRSGVRGEGRRKGR